MSTVMPFSFEEHAVRALTRDGEPWFVLADVCGVLDITNSRNVTDRMDDDEKGVHTVDTLGGPQEMSIINESGLYNLIFTSRKPEARRFRKWVTGEVLPAIRKTGSFGLPSTPQEWFNHFARVLCLWDALGPEAALQEWKAIGPLFPMPRKQALRLLMEAALDLPANVLPPEPAGSGRSTTATRISSRHNGALGGRPRKGESPQQAASRRFHMVEKEVTPSPDGSNAVVVTYATHKGA
ncbi:BRO-N domain-containing protein [Acetobacter senegalensis]|uniref:BRO-N domain-containing protein n=1 Tax=Acetobacter senegalensis TaxID=446692 RepID=UPI001EDBA6B8|nr:Bro-N domain-containing protein [Acetobacter senegalensis]MCG4258027.1 Bro-N domain-containing protein [Acetobacter senegalensis]MCG4267954.1 Bro-N domain-containing protein [Acetobacter senegalensis]